MRKFVAIISGLIAFIAILAAVVYEDVEQAASYQQERRLQVLNHLSAIRANLEAEVNAQLSLVYGLVALVKSHPELSDIDFKIYAASLLEQHPAVRNIQLAPAGVVTYVYPLTGNEAALGHDLLADPARRDAAERTIRDRKFVIAGPIELKQGGVALIGRYPIFLPANQKQADTGAGFFWGFATILIDFAPLLDNSGMIGSFDNLSYALRGRHGLGEAGDIFFGTESLFDDSPVTLTISLPNGSWLLASAPEAGWNEPWPGRALMWTIGIGTGVVVGLLIYFLVRRTRELRAETTERKLVEDTLYFLSQRGWEQSEEDFFTSLVKYLGTSLEVDFAFVDILLDDKHTARTVALYAMGQFPDNIEYDLKSTPCDNVIGKNLCCYPEHIQQLFPKDQLLVEMGAESYSGIPLWDSQSQPIGLVAVMDSKPLNDPQRVQTVLQLIAVRAAHELERIRDEQLLIAAKEEAIAANNAKSEFLASMSHDLRTPLNAIMGFSDMMHTGAFGPLGHPKYVEYTQDISKSSKLLESLINDILDLNKIEAGKYDLNEQELTVSHLIEDCVNMATPQSKAKGITLTSQIEGGLPSLIGDERVITQVLNNLLSNAVKFSLQHDEVIIATDLDDNAAIRIRIIDTGVGMTAEEARRVMRPFEQTDSSLSRQSGGTGLGLPLCEKFMHLHDGTMEIESYTGRGTTVTVTFPAERAVHRARARSSGQEGHIGLPATGHQID